MNVKILPGLNNSDSKHWQSVWSKKYGFDIIDQEDWHHPKYSDWEKNLIESLEKDNDYNTILVTHSLGGLLAAKAMPKIRKYIKAVFIVAPPDPQSGVLPGFLDTFKDIPETNLNVNGFLIYSENDEYALPSFSIEKGRQWGLHTISVGSKGHINSKSNLGDWKEGYNLFQQLLSLSEPLKIAQ